MQTISLLNPGTPFQSVTESPNFDQWCRNSLLAMNVRSGIRVCGQPDSHVRKALPI
jgi:hypothetical protein